MICLFIQINYKNINEIEGENLILKLRWPYFKVQFLFEMNALFKLWDSKKDYGVLGGT